MSAIKVRPIQDDVPFGAWITGVTPEVLEDEDVRKEIRGVFVKRGLIVFENVEQSTEMQLKLSTVMGPIKEHPARRRSNNELQTGLGEIAGGVAVAPFPSRRQP